jgi:activator of 2-hydroxyglutaryl-CoA dehydratase
MKTVFLAESKSRRSKQIFMQSACSGGTFIEKTARKLRIEPERLARMGYDGYALHRISSKCGIFAEADANTLLKSGVPVEEIMASLFEAVVHQNVATLTKGQHAHTTGALARCQTFSSAGCSRPGGGI